MSNVEHVAQELRVIEAEVAAERGLPFSGWADLTDEKRDEYRHRARRLLRAAGRPT